MLRLCKKTGHTERPAQQQPRCGTAVRQPSRSPAQQAVQLPSQPPALSPPEGSSTVVCQLSPSDHLSSGDLDSTQAPARGREREPSWASAQGRWHASNQPAQPSQPSLTDALMRALVQAKNTQHSTAGK